MLEDSQVTIQRMLSSPFLADHKVEAEKWEEQLGDAQEIIQLWITSQTKVSNLLSITFCFHCNCDNCWSYCCPTGHF